MTQKTLQTLEDTAIALADVLADLRQLIDEYKECPIPNTGCTRCDIEQQAYNDTTRMCPKHTQEAKGN